MNLPPDKSAVGVGVELADGEDDAVGDADGLVVGFIFNLVIAITALSAACVLLALIRNKAVFTVMVAVAPAERIFARTTIARFIASCFCFARFPLFGA